ncbi:SMP-30/gluconolactonase/LRE family protein [Robbsia sp. Bb-Pol-6]|uniref:SMP-30/gluconolactonase/LRE family protein n=1 Tax=Robbsia betulipollinis TaxID=2981849 RepID=A0ABT3ZHS1_9BURK|nr:SMP-30/gluconolactonase/LRE family protein [Robbsia betulipollinis]MCY0386074.1 SMP-30/gluconolactonase/LRE family protein [Robbsia betulipollinis]
MSWAPPPPVLDSAVHAALPASLRKPGVVTEWSRANKGGAAVDSFIEGPCFDPQGNLYIVDIPHGRIFRIAASGMFAGSPASGVAAAPEWQLVAEYDGEPNGLAWHPQHKLLIADYKNGVLALDPTFDPTLDPAHGGSLRTPTVVIARRNGERFKGPNDLIVARNGDIYFTDQGQTGLSDPTGRVYRLAPSGRLDCLLANGPSPNGLVLDAEEKVLFVAMTRDNAVWRLPLQADGGTSKVGRFASFHGTSGPDGLAMDAHGNLFVAHASLGSVFVLTPHGEPLARIASCAGRTLTNVAFDPRDAQRLFITDSSTGSVLSARCALGG